MWYLSIDWGLPVYVIYVIYFADYSFTSYSDKSCLAGNLGNLTPDNSDYYDNCKEWCAARDDCGGITIYGAKCNFKDNYCKNNLRSISLATLFVKNVNWCRSSTWWNFLLILMIFQKIFNDE